MFATDLPRNNGNVTLSTLFLKKKEITPTRCHANAAALLYCMQGMVTVNMAHPVVNDVKAYSITSRQVVNIPQGLWHFIKANEESRCLVIFDDNEPRTIFASDCQRLKEVEPLVENTSNSLRQRVTPKIEIQPYYFHHGKLSFPTEAATRH